jgi:hypothetical protein
MLYDISIRPYVDNPWNGETHKTMDFPDDAAAEKYVNEWAEQVTNEIKAMPQKVRNSSSQQVSDKNWTLKEGGIYAVKRYSKYLPAVCIDSGKRWHRDFEHTLKFIKTDKRICLYGKNPDRLGDLLCEDGKIGKDSCTTCMARFVCYTKSND